MDVVAHGDVRGDERRTGDVHQDEVKGFQDLMLPSALQIVTCSFSINLSTSSGSKRPVR